MQHVSEGVPRLRKIKSSTMIHSKNHHHKSLSKFKKLTNLVVVMMVVNLWIFRKLQSRIRFTERTYKWQIVCIEENYPLADRHVTKF